MPYETDALDFQAGDQLLASQLQSIVDEIRRPSAVIRGGSGLYFNDILNTNVLWPMSPLTIAVIRVNNDGRADFASNPFNGPLPTYQPALQRFASLGVLGELREDFHLDRA